MVPARGPRMGHPRPLGGQAARVRSAEVHIIGRLKLLNAAAQVGCVRQGQTLGRRKSGSGCRPYDSTNVYTSLRKQTLSVQCDTDPGCPRKRCLGGPAAHRPCHFPGDTQGTCRHTHGNAHVEKCCPSLVVRNLHFLLKLF